jgi:hypothetical protein
MKAKTILLVALAVALVLVLAVLSGCDKKTPEPQGLSAAQSVFRYIEAQGVSVNGFVKVAVPTAVGTATPAMIIDSAGALGNLLELRKNQTPVFYVDVDGNATYTGFTSGGGLESNPVGVRAPTSVGTATPAFFADSAGGVSNPFEIRYSQTPVVVVNKTGNVTASGSGSFANAVYVAVPSGVGTATPALFANSAGGSGNLFELRQAATPMVQVSAAGAATFGSTLGVTGASTLTGLLNANGGIAVDTDAFTVADTSGNTVVKGTFAANSGITVDSTAFTVADTSGNTAIAGTLTVSGMATMGRKVIAKTGVSAALTAAEVAWTVVSDLGDTAGITITLPAAVAGMDVVIMNFTGEDIILDSDDADRMFGVVDAAGDKATNTTAYDYVHLVALDGSGWVLLDSRGTWTDAN